MVPRTCLFNLMQARVDWVLIIFGTQAIEKKRPIRPMFPEYLSVSYGYDLRFYLFVSGVNQVIEKGR